VEVREAQKEARKAERKYRVALSGYNKERLN
jgi:hypothetical protein